MPVLLTIKSYQLIWTSAPEKPKNISSQNKNIIQRTLQALQKWVRKITNSYLPTRLFKTDRKIEVLPMRFEKISNQ